MMNLSKQDAAPMNEDGCGRYAPETSCVGDDCATSTTLISEYDLPLWWSNLHSRIPADKNRASMILLPSTPTRTAPGTVDATATAVNMPFDPAQVKQNVALARSAPTLVVSAVPEVTGLEQYGILAS